MAESSTRTIVIFGIIGLVLMGLVIGGVRVLKARDTTYAATPHPPAAGSKPASTPQASKPAAPQQNPVTVTPPVSQPQVAVTPPSTQSAPPSSSATPSVASLPHNVPNTSASSDGLWVTGGLVVLAGIFGHRLLRARASYRRYLHG